MHFHYFSLFFIIIVMNSSALSYMMIRQDILKQIL